MNETVLTILALITVVILPGVVGGMTGLRRGGELVKASLAAAVIALVWAAYWVTAVHYKHAFLYVALAIVGVDAASFSRPLERGSS